MQVTFQWLHRIWASKTAILPTLPCHHKYRLPPLHRALWRSSLHVVQKMLLKPVDMGRRSIEGFASSVRERASGSVSSPSSSSSSSSSPSSPPSSPAGRSSSPNPKSRFSFGSSLTELVTLSRGKSPSAGTGEEEREREEGVEEEEEEEEAVKVEKMNLLQRHWMIAMMCGVMLRHLI